MASAGSGVDILTNYSCNRSCPTAAAGYGETGSSEVASWYTGSGFVVWLFLGLRVTMQVVGSLGNCLLIASVLRFPWLRNYHSYLVCNLCVSDTALLLYETAWKVPVDVLKMDLERFSRVVQPSPTICFVDTFQNVIRTCQIMNLLAVCIERFVVIHRPLDYRFQMNRYIVSLIASCWIIGLIPVSVINCVVCQDFVKGGYLRFRENTDLLRSLMWKVMLIWFLLIIVMYSKTFYTLNKHISQHRMSTATAKSSSTDDPAANAHSKSSRDSGVVKVGVAAAQTPATPADTPVESGQRLPVQMRIHRQASLPSERTLLKSYAIRLGFALIPETLRLVMIAVDNQQAAANDTAKLMSHIMGQLMLLTMIGSSSTSAFIYGGMQSCYHRAFRLMLRLDPGGASPGPHQMRRVRPHAPAAAAAPPAAPQLTRNPLLAVPAGRHVCPPTPVTARDSPLNLASTDI